MHRTFIRDPASSLSRLSLLKLLVAAALCIPRSYGEGLQNAGAVSQDIATNDIENGIRLLQSRSPADAKLRFSAALKANPNSAEAFTWRGIAENDLNQFKDAARDFEAALRLNPALLSAHYNLSLSLIRLGQKDRAIEELRFVVKSQPEVFESEYNLALLLEQTHSIAEAIEPLQAAYRARPDDAGVIQHLLIDLAALGRESETKQILERIDAIDSVELKRTVGTALLNAGSYQQAIFLLENLPAQTQSNPESSLLLARAYIGAHEDFKAIDLLKPLETTDRTGETAYLVGVALLDAGATEDAKSSFKNAVERDPRNGPALYHLALIESVQKEQLPAAIKHLREAIRLGPVNASYEIALGKMLLQSDNAREAEVHLENTHVDGPEAGQRDLLLGIAQIIEHGPGVAIPTLERAVVETPDVALAQNILGFCYFTQGDITRAATYYAKASDLSPETRLFAHGAAEAFDRSSDLERGLVFAERAASLPDAEGEDHYLFGKLLSKAGRNEDAVRQLTKAITLVPDLEEAYYQLVRTYMQTGDSEKASEWVTKLKELKQRVGRSDAVRTQKDGPMKPSVLLKGASAPTSVTESP